MTRYKRDKGKLIHWNNEKGYGFIRSHKDENDIFLHVKSLPHYQRRPKISDVLTYEIGIDEKQQHYARSAKIKGIAWSHFTFFWLTILLFFGIYVYFVIQKTLPFHPLAIYAAISLLTIWAYSKDKSAAQLGAWRTSERRLHLLELFGGWPGALLAQQYFHHKSRKMSYQLLFWLIVTSHCFLWYYILNRQETYRPYQQIATEKVQSFVNQTTKQIIYLYEKINPEDMFADADHAEMNKPVKTAYRSRPSKKQLVYKAKKGNRSTIIPDKQLRIIKGIVKEIRPQEGVIVSLQLGTITKGIIDKSTLTKNFSTLFKPEESILVAIHTIKMKGNKKRIELILAE